MKKKLTTPKNYLFFSLLALLFSVNVYAQPANDDCANAVDITIGADAGSATLEDGTTVNGTGSTEPADVCSGSWFGDDVWYSITTPASLPTDQLLKIQLFFGDQGGDIPAAGMSFYEGCGMNMPALYCFSDASGIPDEFKLYTGNLSPSTTYYIRVWSGGSPSDDSGTFRIGAWWESMAEDVVLWQGGEFDGGLNGWTVQSINGDTSLWRYEADARTNGSFRRATISSPTAFNGAMAFDADSMNTVFGVPAGPPYPQLIGELISPAIDASSFSAVSLKFYHAYSPLNYAGASFSYSTDDGATWSPAVDVAEAIAANEIEEVGNFERFFLPELANQTAVRVKFTFDGDFYYWIIDDVTLIQPENNNLVVMDNFYAIAPSAMWPISQTEEFGFLADVANVGAAAQPNTTLNITITDDNSGADVYSADLDFGTIDPDTLVENTPWPDACFMPDAMTSYTGTYSISSDSLEFDPSDNSRSFNFMMTDSVFAKEMGITRTVTPATANWDDGEVRSWAMGNFYHIVRGSEDPSEEAWMAAAAQFGIGNPADIAGEILQVILYSWDDANLDSQMDPDERIIVGNAFYSVTGFETPNEFITVPLTTPDGMNMGQVPLTSNTSYALVVEYVTLQDQVTMTLSAAEPWLFSAQTFRTDQNVFGDKPFRGHVLLGINGDLTSEPYSTAGFTGGTIVPAVRLHLAQPQIIINVTELDDANKVEVAPNPADTYINLNLEFVNQQEEIQISITDATGKVVLQDVYNNVLNETIRFNTNNLPVGTYMLNVNTEEGARTQRFVVQR